MFQIGDTKLTSSFNPRKAVGMKKKVKGRKRTRGSGTENLTNNKERISYVMKF